MVRAPPTPPVLSGFWRWGRIQGGNLRPLGTGFQGQVLSAPLRAAGYNLGVPFLVIQHKNNTCKYMPSRTLLNI